MTLKSYFFSFFLVLFSINSFAQKLEFYREDIRFEIKDGYFYVNGDYYFANVGGDSINTLLFYPFPTDSIYGKADEVSIMLMRDSTNLLQQLNEAGAFFTLVLKPYESNKVNISYRQKLLSNKAEYILLTTKEWGKAFEQVNYTLTVLKNIKVQSLSYPSDKSYSKKDKRIYLWHKENFMPDKNMIIEYKTL